MSSDLDSSGEVSELSEFLGTSSSTKLTEISNEEEWIDSIYFHNLMTSTRKKWLGWKRGPGHLGQVEGKDLKHRGWNLWLNFK